MRDPSHSDSLDALFARANSRAEPGLDPGVELARRRMLSRIAGDASAVTVDLGRFSIVRCVGRGGMSSVFEARDTATGATVALKVLNETSHDALVRLKREFRVLR